MVPSTDDYVTATLKTVGDRESNNGYWSHKLQGFVQDNIISNLFGDDYNAKLAFNSLKDVRRRYFKKIADKEKQEKNS